MFFCIRGHRESPGGPCQHRITRGFHIKYRFWLLPPGPRIGGLLTSLEPHFFAATVAGLSSGPCRCGEARGHVGLPSPSHRPGDVPTLRGHHTAPFSPEMLVQRPAQDTVALPRSDVFPGLEVPCPCPWLRLSGQPHRPWPRRAADFPKGLYRFSE